MSGIGLSIIGLHDADLLAMSFMDLSTIGWSAVDLVSRFTAG